jgi:hypothetical protein
MQGAGWLGDLGKLRFRYLFENKHCRWESAFSCLAQEDKILNSFLATVTIVADAYFLRWYFEMRRQ